VLRSKKLRVLLVDDHDLFRKGLASLLSHRDDMEVIADVENGFEAIQAVRTLAPDLVLMDVHMPRCDGIAAVKMIKEEMPQVKIVMLTAFDHDEDLFAAIKFGADGYVLKNVPSSEFFSLLEGVARGEAAISGALAERILEEFRKPDKDGRSEAKVNEPLTPREIATLGLVIQGKSNKEIGEALAVSENTVKRHLVDILQKVHLKNRVQLAVYAVRIGMDPIAQGFIRSGD
jgi:two-component system nitrate/nitrite response regulator NarL